jgi:hypothetical protein
LRAAGSSPRKEAKKAASATGEGGTRTWKSPLWRGRLQSSTGETTTRPVSSQISPR